MHILKITPAINNSNFDSNKKINRPVQNKNIKTDFNEYFYAKTSEIPFGSMYGIKPKKINIEIEKTKLLKTLDEMLSTNNVDTDWSDMIVNSLKNALFSCRNQLRQQEALLDRLEKIAEDKILNPQQKMDEARRIRKEFRMLNKKTPKPTNSNKQSKPTDEKLDYQLLNTMRASIYEDDFDLTKVFKNYYGKLNEIKTLEELKEYFPKIEIPQRPENVIVKKIESVLTRDFYEELDQCIDVMSEEKTMQLFNKTLQPIFDEISKKYGIDPDEFYNKMVDTTTNFIADKYIRMKNETSFSSVPIQRKIKTPPITQTDIDLLSVNFDDFVLNVLRKQYLDFQKPNDIKYTENNITISLPSLRNSEYKFAKIPEKIKQIINTSSSLFKTQRDYENFDKADFKARLNFFAGKEIGNNEELLERIIAFDNCEYSDEDIKVLVKFLKELDEINDGNQTLEKGLETIKAKELFPKQPENVIPSEIEKNIADFKIEQKKLFELNQLKKNFDNSMNYLYMNNLNNIANTCSKYRPSELTQDTLENTNFIINIINKNLDPANKHVINKPKLEANILRWDTYNYYKTNDIKNPIYLKAIEFAKSENGNIDIDKAGQYIINSEIIDNYPQSMEFVNNPEIITKIIDRTESNKEDAIKYLCKYDSYQYDLTENEKTSLSNILNIFDSKDPVEKILLRDIIENDYINTDTSVLTNIHDTSDKNIRATISSKAKKQILNKYKYPVCIDYLKAFEDALSSFATEKGTSGIKKTNRNNKNIEYKMELKIMGYQERLFSSNNDYYFDIFSEKGFH